MLNTVFCLVFWTTYVWPHEQAFFLRNKPDNGRFAEQSSRRCFLGHPFHAELQGLQGFAGAVYVFFFMPCRAKRFSICTGLTDTPFAEIVWANSGKSASGCLIYSARI